MEIVNELSHKKILEVDNFLTFIGIYDDKKRERAFKKLLWDNRQFVRGKIVVEAGAGLGRIADYLVNLGAKKVFAVEENKFCVDYLQKKFKDSNKVEVIHSAIEKFIPSKNYKIDLLFQELYGALILDESLLNLERIKFDPGIVLPNQGVLLGEAVTFEQLKDPSINKENSQFLEGALIADLLPYFYFKKPFVIGKWEFKRRKINHSFKCKLDKKADVLALGMQVMHNGQLVTGTQFCDNWPYVFTLVDKATHIGIDFKYSSSELTKIVLNTK